MERPCEGCSHRFGVNTRSAGPTVNSVQKSVSNHLLLFPGSFCMPLAGSPVLNMVGITVFPSTQDMFMDLSHDF